MDEDGLEATMKHCRRALAMGGPWLWVNPMTDRLHFLHFVKTQQEIMSKCWMWYEGEENFPQSIDVGKKSGQAALSSPSSLGSAGSGTRTPTHEASKAAEEKEHDDEDKKNIEEETEQGIIPPAVPEQKPTQVKGRGKGKTKTGTEPTSPDGAEEDGGKVKDRDGPKATIKFKNGFNGTKTCPMYMISQTICFLVVMFVSLLLF